MAVTEKLGRWRSVQTEEEELRIFEKELENLEPDEAEALVLLLNEIREKKPVSMVKEYIQPDGSRIVDSGGSFLSLIQEVEFERPVVSVEEWLSDSYFMGNSGFRWERWKEDIVELFSGSYHECVLTGAIGIGKSTFVEMALCRMIYEFSCLRDPQRTYDLTPGSKIFIACMNVNKTLAKEVVYDKIANRIDSCEYFKREFPMEYTMKEMRFPKQLKVIPASSSDMSMLGLNVIGGAMSETNFMDGGHQAKTKSQAAATKASWASNGLTSDVGHVFSELVTRLKSRFGRVGKLPGLFILDSSKRDQSDWMEQHMVEVKDDPFVFVRDYAMWEVQPATRFDKKKFRVFVGDEKVSSRILGAGDEVVPTPGTKQQIIEVPENWRPEFERNLDAAIRNVAGIATSSIDRLFGSMEPVARAIERGRGYLDSPFGTDVWVMDRPIEAKWDRVAKIVDGAWKLKQDPKAEHAVHLDIAYSRDRFGVGAGYIAGEKQVEKIIGGNRVIEVWPHIVIRWVLALQAPRDREIEIGVGRALVWSATQHGHKIRWGSCDSFQSVETIQKFKARGMDAEILSVENEEPYLCLRDAFNEDRMTLPDSTLLYDELRFLVHDKVTQKVDHPPKKSKDVADVVAAITYRLTMLYLEGTLRVGTGAVLGVSEMYEQEEMEEQYWVLGPGAARPVEPEERRGGIIGGGADRASDQMRRDKPFIVK